MSKSVFWNMTVAVVLVLLFATRLPQWAVAAKAKEVTEPRVFVNAGGARLNYRLMKPLNYDNTRAYPLVLLLHGAGEKGDDNLAQLAHGMDEFACDDNRQAHPCFVVAPQCPKEASWALLKNDRLEPGADPTEPMLRTIELLDTLPGEFSIDRRRVYVTGMSMGGYGAWYLAQRFPERFAAIVPLCGGGDDRQAAKLVKIPIWVFHGGADTGNTPEMSREMVKAIRAAGGNPLYTEYPGVNHNCWDLTYGSPLLYTWMFNQRLPQ
jgi:predicted peptidase